MASELREPAAQQPEEDVDELSLEDDEEGRALGYHDVVCDECGMYPIEGNRYHSTRIIDYDVCVECYEASHKHLSLADAFVPIPVGHDIDEKKYFEKRGWVREDAHGWNNLVIKLQNTSVQNLSLYNEGIREDLSEEIREKLETSIAEHPRVGAFYAQLPPFDDDRQEGFVLSLIKGILQNDSIVNVYITLDFTTAPQAVIDAICGLIRPAKRRNIQYVILLHQERQPYGDLDDDILEGVGPAEIGQEYARNMLAADDPNDEDPDEMVPVAHDDDDDDLSVDPDMPALVAPRWLVAGGGAGRNNILEEIEDDHRRTLQEMAAFREGLRVVVDNDVPDAEEADRPEAEDSDDEEDPDMPDLVAPDIAAQLLEDDDSEIDPDMPDLVYPDRAALLERAVHLIWAEEGEHPEANGHGGRFLVEAGQAGVLQNLIMRRVHGINFLDTPGQNLDLIEQQEQERAARKEERFHAVALQIFQALEGCSLHSFALPEHDFSEECRAAAIHAMRTTPNLKRIKAQFGNPDDNELEQLMIDKRQQWMQGWNDLESTNETRHSILKEILSCKQVEEVDQVAALYHFIHSNPGSLPELDESTDIDAGESPVEPMEETHEDPLLLQVGQLVAAHGLEAVQRALVRDQGLEAVRGVMERVEQTE